VTYIVRPQHRGPLGPAYTGHAREKAGVETTHRFVGPAKVAANALQAVTGTNWCVIRDGHVVWCTI